MKSINPATGEQIREFEPLSKCDVSARCDAAGNAFRQWKGTTFSQRAELMRKAAAVLRGSQANFARLMTAEMGKPIKQSRAEIEKCAWGCKYYAEQAEAFLAPENKASEAPRSYLRYDPLGPVLAVMPWNFPFWQVFRFAAPALMAGNVALLKHASNVCGVALAIEQIFAEAGFPSGVFQTLLIRSDDVAGVVAHDAVRAVTLTGSERAGRSVAEVAGKHLKKSVLELGGSDPFIVLADADVQQAADAAAKARTLNSGQSCIAAKRFIVDASIADAFEDAFVAAMNKLKVGDPMSDDTEIGPLARQDLRDDLHDQVQRSVDAGARLRTGGRGIDPGYFYQPTVLGNVTPGMAAFDEETFGPVGAVIRARDDDEAVELANRSTYGLGASLWSSDREHAERLVPRIESGMVFVNEITKSVPQLPFGGVKRSGYGRELSDLGIREFVNIKTVWVN